MCAPVPLAVDTSGHCGSMIWALARPPTDSRGRSAGQFRGELSDDVVGNPSVPRPRNALQQVEHRAAFTRAALLET